MKSLGMAGMIVLGVGAWMASAAHGQSVPYSSSMVSWSDDGPAPPVAAPESSDSCFGAPGNVNTYTNANSPYANANDMPSGIVNNGSAFRNWFDGSTAAPCNPCGTCDCCGGGKWYGAVLGLVMTRNRAPANWLTHASNDNFDLLLNSQNAGADWTGGAQVTAGYAFGGGCSPKIVFTYWALSAMTGSGSVTDQTGNPATALSSTIDFSGVTINGSPGSVFFDNASEQAVWRKDGFTNFEANFQTATYTLRSLQLTGLVGFRYFRFTENLIYGSASFGNTFDTNGGADAAFLNLQTQNNLYGAQVGSVINSILTERLTVYLVPKFGIFANQMNNVAQVYAGNAMSSPDVYYTTNKTDVSVLSELDFGLGWAIRPNLQFTCGYRIVAISNLSLADNQFAAYNHVEQNGDLILHGGLFGLAGTF